MSFPASALIGFFLGFAFGVGCALAVLYSIYLGGYRAGVRDTQLPQETKQLRKTWADLAKERSSTET